MVPPATRNGPRSPVPFGLFPDKSGADWLAFRLAATASLVLHRWAGRSPVAPYPAEVAGLSIKVAVRLAPRVLAENSFTLAWRSTASLQVSILCQHHFLSTVRCLPRWDLLTCCPLSISPHPSKHSPKALSTFWTCSSISPTGSGPRWLSPCSWCSPGYRPPAESYAVNQKSSFALRNNY